MVGRARRAPRVPLDTTATTTAELLDDVVTVRMALVADRSGALPEEPRSIAGLPLVSPVTAPCRVVARMTNFVSRVRDSGMDLETVRNDGGGAHDSLCLAARGHSPRRCASVASRSAWRGLL